MTTLGGRDLQDGDHKHANQYDHEFYLAIYPTAPPCPFLYPTLYLKGVVELRKSSYLCIKQRHTIPLKMLEPYDRRRSWISYQLTAESFAVVANTFAMTLPVPAKASATVTAGISHPETLSGDQSSQESDVAKTHDAPEQRSEKGIVGRTELPNQSQSKPKEDSATILAHYVLAKLPSACTQF